MTVTGFCDEINSKNTSFASLPLVVCACGVISGMMFVWYARQVMRLPGDECCAETQRILLNVFSLYYKPRHTQPTFHMFTNYYVFFSHSTSNSRLFNCGREALPSQCRPGKGQMLQHIRHPRTPQHPPQSPIPVYTDC